MGADLHLAGLGQRSAVEATVINLVEAAQPDRTKGLGTDDEAPGWPLAELSDQFALDALEVHRSVQPDTPPLDLPVLTPYVQRKHDKMLRQIVHSSAVGTSGIAVLVGGSSTGKTRACWESIQLLRGQPRPWRLWNPISPSRSEALMRDLSAVRPHTVVWLDEAQLYLDPETGPGEYAAASLRDLLRDKSRAPVLVLATLWPDYWDALTRRPIVGPDPHAQARALLDDHYITVPGRFTEAQMQQLFTTRDVRLSMAAEAARDGQVIQFLAGAPDLLARYHNAPPPARAIIEAAMDALRFGMNPALPYVFLEAAADGYLDDTEWSQLTDD